jgi:hypothetical protein
VTTLACKNPGCGNTFESGRPYRRFCSVACRDVWSAAITEESRERAAQLPSEHPLAGARAEQEASDLNSQLGQIVYQGIINQLERRGQVHADDLEPYFPSKHRERCRKLIGAQFGSLVSRRYIYEIERRKSEVASRRGAKSGVFGFTRLGRMTLAGVGAGVPSPQGMGTKEGSARTSGLTTCADPGENPLAGLNAGVRVPASVESGETPGAMPGGMADSVGVHTPLPVSVAPGAARLFELEAEPKRPSMFDVDSEAA